MVELSHAWYLPGAGGQRAALMPAVLLSSAAQALLHCKDAAARQLAGKWDENTGRSVSHSPGRG